MDLNFIQGKAIVKSGRKTVAKVYDRAVYFPANGIKCGFSHPYSLEMSVGMRECDTLEEVQSFILKYS